MLRTLIIYLVATAAALFAVSRYVVPLSNQVRVLLVVVPLLVTGPALLTGRTYGPVDIAYQTDPLKSVREMRGVGEPRSPVLNDVAMQMIPWRHAVREAVTHGRLPLWNPFILCGEPLLAVMQPATLHPFTWLGLLLPLSHAWTLEMTLGLFLALLSGYALFRDLSLSPVASAFGGTVWAFSDYLRFHAGWPHSAAAAPFPLLLLGLRRLAVERSRSGVAVTIVSLFLTAVAGHPESLFHAVAAGGLWFLYCLAFEAHRGRGRAVLMALAAGTVTAGLTAVILLPHVEAIRQTYDYFFRSTWWVHQKKSMPLKDSLATMQQILIPYVLGVPDHGSMAAKSQIPQAYVGSVALPLALLGLASRRRIRWILLLLGALGAAAWARFPVIADGISALPLFDLAINERLVFLFCFSVAALAAIGIDSLRDDLTHPFFRFALVSLLILIGGFLLNERQILARGMPGPFLMMLFGMQVVPLALVVLGASPALRLTPSWIPSALLLLLVGQRAAETSYLYPTVATKAFYPPLDLLASIPRGAPYRMAALGMAFIPNVSTMYGLEDVRGYDTMKFKPLVETYPLWCGTETLWFNRIDDASRPFLSFLNMRYLIAAPGAITPSSWRTIAEGPGGRVVENPHVLPRAFAPSEVLVEPDPSKRLQALATVRDFATLGVVSEWPGHGPRSRSHNGETSVAIIAYDADYLSLETDSGEPSLVATSVTAWKGWRLKVDGVDAPLLEYNHAFLAFVAPPGRHRATLTYLPASVVLGAAISVLSFLSVVAWGLAARKRAALHRRRC